MNAKKLPVISSIPNVFASGGAGETPAWGVPDIVLSAPAGIAILTPQSASFNAGNTTSVAACQDINLLAQANAGYSVKMGISLFTYGKASNPKKPNQETGIKLHAASGKVSSQSQSDKTQVTADKAITVASTHNAVQVQAKEHVLLTAQGAYIKMSGGNIEVHAPGKVDFKASLKSWTGPAKDSAELTVMPKASELNNFIELNYRWDDLQPMVHAPFKVIYEGGRTISGLLDAKGFKRLEHTPNEIATIVYGEDERDAKPRKPHKANLVLGSKPTSAQEAQTILDRYLAQEDAYYKDNFFPDELADMAAMPPDGAISSELQYDFHYDDYLYADEHLTDDIESEKTYKELHNNEANDGEAAST